MSSDMLPLAEDLSGQWKLIPDRSTTINGILAELGIGWWARRIMCGITVTSNIVHTPCRWRIRDNSAWTSACSELMIDGRAHTIIDANLRTATVTARNCSGRFALDTVLDNGMHMHEERWLEKRSVMVHTISVIRDGKKVATAVRYYGRVESASERKQGDMSWYVTGLSNGKLVAPPPVPPLSPSPASSTTTASISSTILTAGTNTATTTDEKTGRKGEVDSSDSSSEVPWGAPLKPFGPVQHMRFGYQPAPVKKKCGYPCKCPKKKQARVCA